MSLNIHFHRNKPSDWSQLFCCTIDEFFNMFRAYIPATVFYHLQKMMTARNHRHRTRRRNCVKVRRNANKRLRHAGTMKACNYDGGHEARMRVLFRMSGAVSGTIHVTAISANGIPTCKLPGAELGYAGFSVTPLRVLLSGIA
jgi:hypothetical protein